MEHLKNSPLNKSSTSLIFISHRKNI